MEKIKFKLENPEHGWLPVCLAIEDFHMNFDASDVPNNPIQDLITSLVLAIQCTESKVYWHLEPGYYIFSFIPNGEKQFEFNLARSNSENSNEELLKQVSGTFSSIILPFYRAIKTFTTYNFNQKHWPQLSTEEISKLTGLVKANKLNL